MEFSHQFFQKGHPYLLEHIKRKIGNPKQAEAEKTTSSKTETVTRVLNEVKNMNRRQESLDSRFSAMKQENEALWREVAILRQKHQKQQNIVSILGIWIAKHRWITRLNLHQVNKLIQFLVTIVQPQRSGLSSGIGKRRCQLMIDEAPQSKVNNPKASNQLKYSNALSFVVEKVKRADNQWTHRRALGGWFRFGRNSNVSCIFIFCFFWPWIYFCSVFVYSKTTNIQSPGSQSSKGSSSFDQDYTYASASSVPDVMANFINNNYGKNNYYAADFQSNFLRPDADPLKKSDKLKCGSGIERRASIDECWAWIFYQFLFTFFAS